MGERADMSMGNTLRNEMQKTTGVVHSVVRLRTIAFDSGGYLRTTWRAHLRRRSALTAAPAGGGGVRKSQDQERGVRRSEEERGGVWTSEDERREGRRGEGWERVGDGAREGAREGRREGESKEETISSSSPSKRESVSTVMGTRNCGSSAGGGRKEGRKEGWMDGRMDG
eukprot:3108829-Rhodomonas_salina.1